MGSPAAFSRRIEPQWPYGGARGCGIITAMTLQPLKYDVAAGLARQPRPRLLAMAEAAAVIEDSYRVLSKAGTNIVAQCLAHQGTFYELDHYPKGDVYDAEFHTQYYYHAHRPESGEHGHFHTFVRAAAIPPDARPVPYSGSAKRPMDKDALAHLVAISMDRAGFPIGLFTTNRWVTDETFYPAGDVINMLGRFKIDHTFPCLAVNRWITAMVTPFRPQIEALVSARDETIAHWAAANPGRDVYENRKLEIASMVDIDAVKQIAAVRYMLGIRTPA
jgi:hypothetical protein